MPIERRRDGRGRIRSPRYSRCPLLGRTNPQMTLKRVVFPAPLGPMTPTTSPGSTRRETESRAVRPPNWTVTSDTDRPSPRAIGAILSRVGERPEQDPKPARGRIIPRLRPPVRLVHSDPKRRETGGCRSYLTGITMNIGGRERRSGSNARRRHLDESNGSPRGGGGIDPKCRPPFRCCITPRRSVFGHVGAGRGDGGHRPRAGASQVGPRRRAVRHRRGRMASTARSLWPCSQGVPPHPIGLPASTRLFAGSRRLIVRHCSSSTTATGPTRTRSICSCSSADGSRACRSR